MIARVLAPLALTLTLAGCAADETLSPVSGPPSPPAATPTTPSSEGPPQAEPVGPRKRVVLHENPFGIPADNLLVDGDFEMSTVRGGYIPQLGWITIQGNAERAAKAETGGLCRTGLRCAVLESGMIFLGKGAAAPHSARMIATLWAQLPEGSPCDVIEPWLLDGETFATLRKLKSAENVPIEGPWCRYQATSTGRTSAVWLYVDSSLPSGSVALVDSAVLAADDGVVPVELGGVEAPTAEQQARLAVARRRFRDRLGAGDLAHRPPGEPEEP